MKSAMKNGKITNDLSQEEVHFDTMRKAFAAAQRNEKHPLKSDLIPSDTYRKKSNVPMQPSSQRGMRRVRPVLIYGLVGAAVAAGGFYFWRKRKNSMGHSEVNP